MECTLPPQPCTSRAPTILSTAQSPPFTRRSGRHSRMRAIGVSSSNHVTSETLSSAAAATLGQICLGFGYSGNDPELALAASLVLVGAGYAQYGEVLGHHLREGFGTTPNPAAAVGWYQSALASLDAGAAPVVLPSKSAERAEVIRAAITGDQTQAGIPTASPALVPTSAKVPAHVIAQ